MSLESICAVKNCEVKENLTNVSDSQQDTEAHLKAVKQTSAKLSESDLILIRAGLGVDDQDCWICDKHRDDLGIRCRPQKSCQHPLHNERPNPSRHICDRSFSKSLVEEVMSVWGILVPLGSGTVIFDRI